MKELFGQSLVNELSQSDRISAAVPGQVAAKNILFSKLWVQLKSIFGTNNWRARTYESSPCIVIYDKIQYILDENIAPLPFESTDFTTELSEGKWVALGGGGGGHTIKDSTTTFTQRAGLKFTGNVTITDDSVGDNTVININNPTLTTSDVPDSTNKRYVTDAQITVIQNTSGTNTGDQTASTLPVTTPSGYTSTNQAGLNSEITTEQKNINIYFDDVSPSFAAITRPYNFKIASKTDVS